MSKIEFLGEGGIESESEEVFEYGANEDKKLKTFQVDIDYPSECMTVEAYNKEDAEKKVWEMLGEQTVICEKVCTLEINEVLEDE